MPVGRSSRHAAAVRARSWNPIAKGAGPFYFPDGKARFNVASLHPADRRRRRRVSSDLTTGRVVSHFLFGHANAAHRTACRSISGTADRDASATGRAAGHQGRRLATVESRRGRDHAASTSRNDDSARHGLHSVSLGRAQERESIDYRRPGPDFENSGIQSLRGASRRPSIAPEYEATIRTSNRGAMQFPEHGILH